ncbi:hypothetical protein FHL15_006282 [Xylaria flabelliformis]|uniref:Charged multivesicular body protein 6 n=1 Tax=Xylaria flabelliformis TaxID=2512241 RepID=A0A553HY44_9PEZI|nr:hypothetical protein FHL15_006282 [Xylaria flabelliformis]
MGNTPSRVTAQDKYISPPPYRRNPTQLTKPTNTTHRAILDLKNQRDKLHQYQRRITLLTDKETDIARQMLAAGDKKRALLALRRKKYQEQLLSKTDAQLAQLEQLMRNVEFALIQKDIVYGLQQGTAVLKEIHAEMGGIEHVEKLMGETADAIAYQKVKAILSYLLSLSFSLPHARARGFMINPLTTRAMQEVSDMLGERITNQDEEEVEDELAALERETNGLGPLPAVPNTTPSVPEVATPEQKQRNKPARRPERQAMLAS